MGIDTGSTLESKYDLVDRQIFRSLYARINDFNVDTEYPLRIGIVFCVGLPRRSSNCIFEGDGYNVTLANRAEEAFKDIENPYPLVLRSLQEEVLQYNDLLDGDYEDIYYNLTTKLMTDLGRFLGRLEAD
ncbi:unnamed protein product [Dibothriocephalus latus]|uniref:Uncharacterized protein n=1 Tax=Dibothriocephalus latus TaxID=60516 RepID=A0A3P7M2R1_DIBLA|nr:unnamed protein product [Dibothriocephalus latus]